MKSRFQQAGTVAAAAALVIGLAACGSSGGGNGSNTGGNTPGNTGSNTGGSTGGSTFSDPASGVTATTINYGLIYDQTGATAATQVPFGDGFLSAIKAGKMRVLAEWS